ncbi:DUF4184 family protein [Nocardia sp. NPDC050793]|uniref:DUF4184 family protein n=1 Tax=Nocardia sp. NPDC050793 TaxID=3155159 RepID=UPI0033E4F6CB
MIATPPLRLVPDCGRGIFGLVPFTFAHPAAVLPLRRYLHLPAMVAGTVAPDALYYVPVSLHVDTHSINGLLVWDVLLGLVLLQIFRMTADPLLALAPTGLRRRVPPPPRGFRSLAGQLTTATSVLVGATTHLVWDAFTQTDGAAVRRWAWLQTAVSEPHKLYNVIGYASSIGGMIVLGSAVVGWYGRTRASIDRPGLRPRIRWAVLAGIAALAALGAVTALAGPASRTSGYDVVRSALIGGVQAGVGVALIYAVAWNILACKSSRRGLGNERSGEAPDG